MIGGHVTWTAPRVIIAVSSIGRASIIVIMPGWWQRRTIIVVVLLIMRITMFSLSSCLIRSDLRRRIRMLKVWRVRSCDRIVRKCVHPIISRYIRIYVVSIIIPVVVIILQCLKGIRIVGHRDVIVVVSLIYVILKSVSRVVWGVLRHCFRQVLISMNLTVDPR